MLSALILAASSGLVVLVGEGGVVEGDVAAEIAAERRLILAVGPLDKAPDPFASAGVISDRIVLDPEADHAGDAREAADRVRRAGCIVLTGGTIMNWHGLLTPGGGTTRLSEAIREAHGAGTCIVGVGAAAPFLAQWSMVERSELTKPQRNPRRIRENVAIEGLGLLENVLVDSSACKAGVPARTLRTAYEGSIRNVVFLDGPAVWIADPRSRSARVRGTGTAIVLDLFRARRQRDVWREGRISFLTAGDSWSVRHGAACAESARAPETGGLDPRSESLRASLERMSARLTIRSDEFTRGSACGLCFDVEWDAR